MIHTPNEFRRHIEETLPSLCKTVLTRSLGGFLRGEDCQGYFLCRLDLNPIRVIKSSRKAKLSQLLTDDILKCNQMT
jgi:hypothetical protein